MNIQIIQTILDVFDYYGEKIRFDIERFENALNDEAPHLMDECYLVVQGMKTGIFEIMIFDEELHRNRYVDYLRYIQGMSEEEALFITSVFEACINQMGYYFEIANIDELLEKAFQKDRFYEIFIIARAYFKGFGVKQDYEKAFELFHYLFGHGDDRGAYYLGYMYEYGYGIEQDIEKAIMYYSSHDDDLCTYRMGTLYMLGKYVEHDENLALDYLSKSHEPQAYLYLGILLEKRRDYSGAFQSYLKGTHFYQSECLYKVGVFLYSGIGTELDQKEAYRYFMLAYYCLHGDSAYQISSMYFDGIVMKKDIQKAMDFLRQAADLYSQEACLTLARFYGEGLYVEKNFQKSLEYYQKASEINEYKK